MDPNLWPKLHGASTHFPVALALSAAFFEGLSFILPERFEHKRNLRSAGYYSIIVAALGTLPAVASGLFMTKGEMMGHDALLFHHLFVWPAFTALIGLGVWRVIVDEKDSATGRRCYVIVLGFTSALMMGAGYWGGELILNS